MRRQIVGADGQGVWPVHYREAIQLRQPVTGAQPVAPGLGHPRWHAMFCIASCQGAHRVAVVGHDEVGEALARFNLRVGLDELCREVCRRDGDPGIRIEDVVLEFLCTIHWVDRNHHRVGPQNSKMGNHPLRAVLHGEHDPVTFLDAHLVQRGGQALGLLVHLRESKYLVKKNQCGLVWKTQSVNSQVVP